MADENDERYRAAVEAEDWVMANVWVEQRAFHELAMEDHHILRWPSGEPLTPGTQKRILRDIRRVRADADASRKEEDHGTG